MTLPGQSWTPSTCWDWPVASVHLLPVVKSVKQTNKYWHHKTINKQMKQAISNELHDLLVPVHECVCFVFSPESGYNALSGANMTTAAYPEYIKLVWRQKWFCRRKHINPLYLTSLTTQSAATSRNCPSTHPSIDRYQTGQPRVYERRWTWKSRLS